MNTIDRIKLKMYVANKLELSLFPTSIVLWYIAFVKVSERLMPS